MEKVKVRKNRYYQNSQDISITLPEKTLIRLREWALVNRISVSRAIDQIVLESFSIKEGEYEKHGGKV